MSEVEQIKMCFCPACGRQLPPDIPAKYCLFCGACLPVLPGAYCETKKEKPTKEMRLPQPDKQEDEMLPIVEVARVQPIAAPTETAASYCSVIIKKVIDPVRLTEALMPYLARGEKAIRLAMDMAPTVLIYKGKKAEVQRVLPVLAAEKACYTIVEGDFERETSARRVLPGFLMLQPCVQATLARAPSGLWMGESAAAVLPSVCFEKTSGCLVVTNLHLYFLPDSPKDVGEIYRMWPLTDIAAQDQWEENDWHHVDLMLHNKEKLHFSFHQRELAHRLKRTINDSLS